MAPDSKTHHNDALLTDENSEHTTEGKKFKARVQWSNVGVNVFIHAGFFVGLYYLITLRPLGLTYLWFFAITVLCNLSVTIGVHRLWSHRSFKCNRTLKLILMFFYTMAGQTSIFHWVQIHRVHHKFSETIKDPLDFNRGFFFAHVGWYCLSYHPECEKEMKRIDMDDIKSDKDIMLQYKYYDIVFTILNIMSVLIPWYFWNESLVVAFWTCFVSRFAINFTQLNFTNSANHFFGTRPYDKAQSATDNIACTLFSFGEGYHNYHHVFPYDYHGAEFGDLGHYNLSAFLIDFFASIGWVHDRKKVSADMVKRRVLRTGDGTHFLAHEEAHKTSIYGYGDKDIEPEDQAELEQMTD